MQTCAACTRVVELLRRWFYLFACVSCSCSARYFLGCLQHPACYQHCHSADTVRSGRESELKSSEWGESEEGWRGMAGTQLDILYSLCQYLVTVSPPDRTGHEPHHPMLPSGSAAFILIVLCCFPLSMPGVFLQRFFSIFPISTRLTQSVRDLNYKSDSRQLILSTSDMLLFCFCFFCHSSSIWCRCYY